MIVMKKVISCFLVFLLLFASLVHPVSAEDISVKEISISVDFHGTDFAVNALQSENGKILVPAHWIQYFGSMKMVEEGRYYKFYYVGQEEAAPFAKRIFIEKNGKSFDIRYYENNSSFLDELAIFRNWVIDSVSAISSKSMRELQKAWKVKERELKKMEGEQNNSFSICSGKFSNQAIYQDQLYLPLEEVLPFLNAKVGISEEGKVLIYPNCISLSQALYEAQLGNLTFDAYYDLSYDGKSYADGLSGTAYVVDTILNFKFERLLFQPIANTSDYEKLFKTYLTDDEVYLSAFDKEVTPQHELYNFVADAFEDGENALKAPGNIYKLYKAMKLPEELYSDDLYEVLYKDYGGSDVKGMDIIEGFSKIFDYHRTYSNQVEDHRHMLTTVFSRDLDDLLARYSSPEEAVEVFSDSLFSPAYIAASNTEKLYGEDYSDRLLAASDKALRDYVTQELPKEATKTVLAPFSITSAFTKLILPEEFKLIGDYALIGYMDNSAATAYDAYLSYKFGDEYSTETLNKLRLSAIMALISSKHAYTSIWDENHEKIKDIDALLTKLYLAADGVECDSSDYYGKKKSELEKGLKKIKATDGWSDNSNITSPNSNDIIGTWYATIDGEYGEMTFNSDNTGNVTVENMKRNFRWNIEGNTLSLSEEVSWEMTYRIDGDTLYLTLEGETQVFQRKQSAVKTVIDALDYTKKVIPIDEAMYDPSWTHTIKIPKISASSSNALAFNAKIYKEFSPLHDALLCNGEGSAIINIDYKYKEYNSIIGITVTRHWAVQNSSSDPTYFFYYYDIKNDKELSFDQYLAALGSSRSAILQKMQKTSTYLQEIEHALYTTPEIIGGILDDQSGSFAIKGVDFMWGDTYLFDFAESLM